jgi:Uma2 family endonuclease
MAAAIAPADQIVLLHNVSWETYLRLLEDLGGQSAPRVTFDNGEMEIMSPTSEHEELNRTVARFVEAVTAALDLDIRSVGSTTFSREDLQRGFEPDSGFYIESAPAIAGKTKLDLNTDPPPDLVIEIDISSRSLRKLPIYAALGVREIWRYHNSKLDILLLNGNRYVEAEFSVAFPFVTGKDVLYFVDLSHTARLAAWMRAVADWTHSKVGQ